MKRLQIETVIVAGLMVSLIAFALTQVFNIYQLKTEHVESVVNVMGVTDSSS